MNVSISNIISVFFFLFVYRKLILKSGNTIPLA